MTDSTQKPSHVLPCTVPEGIGISSEALRTPEQLAQAKDSLKRHNARLAEELKSLVELVMGPGTKHPWPDLLAQREDVERGLVEQSEKFRREIDALITEASDEETKSALRQIQATICSENIRADEPFANARSNPTRLPA